MFTVESITRARGYPRRVPEIVAVAVAVVAVTASAALAGGGHTRASASAGAGWDGITREAVSIPMGGNWTSKGELAYPRGARGRLPVVILLHGSGHNDMNVTPKFDPELGPPDPRVLSDIQRWLSKHR